MAFVPRWRGCRGWNSEFSTEDRGQRTESGTRQTKTDGNAVALVQTRLIGEEINTEWGIPNRIIREQAEKWGIDETKKTRQTKQTKQREIPLTIAAKSI